MKIKKDKLKFPVEIFNFKNSKNENKVNLSILLNDNYKNRNNDIFYKNNLTQKSYFLSKFRNNKKYKVKNINIANTAIRRNSKLINKIKMKTKKLLNSKNNQSLNNKSSDDLPKKINEKNYFYNFENEDINYEQNPINRRHYFIKNKSNNELKNSKDEIEIVLNKRIYKRNIDNNASLFTTNSKRISRSYSPNSSTLSSDILKKQISKIVKDISKKHKNRNNTSKFDSKSISKTSTIYALKKNKNKSIDYYAKKCKNKLLNLLNKEGNLNNFLKSMKINTTHNFFKARKKPKNNLEMNKLLINSFGLNKINCNEFSKQLYDLNENYFSTMKKMKKEKAEMELRNLEEGRNSRSNSLSSEIMEEKEKEWETKFMNNIYKNKLSEYEFNNFKKRNRLCQNYNIIKHSKNFADTIMNINLDEYEYPNEFRLYKSSGNFLSINNINRIIKMEKLIKDVEKRELFNVIDMNLEQLKNIQKNSEVESMLAINRAGNPRFIKTKFKERTILKYKTVSGEYLGMPA